MLLSHPTSTSAFCLCYPSLGDPSPSRPPLSPANSTWIKASQPSLPPVSTSVVPPFHAASDITTSLNYKKPFKVPLTCNSSFILYQSDLSKMQIICLLAYQGLHWLPFPRNKILWLHSWTSSSAFCLRYAASLTTPMYFVIWKPSYTTVQPAMSWFNTSDFAYAVSSA